MPCTMFYLALTLSFIIPDNADMRVQIKECSALCVSFFNINKPPYPIKPTSLFSPPQEVKN